MTESNGSGPMTGWAIAQAHGVALIGKRNNTTWRQLLSPVYQLQRHLVQGPRGETGMVCMATPVLMLSSLESLSIPDGAIVIDCGELSGEERKELLVAVEQAEKMSRAIKGAQSGIILAGANATSRLPPIARG